MILEVAILDVMPGSEQYQEWKRILHHFYEQFPVVEHYELLFAHQK